MIKNYKLYLVKVSLYEIDDESRALFTNNKDPPYFKQRDFYYIYSLFLNDCI